MQSFTYSVVELWRWTEGYMKNCPGKGLKFIFHSFQSSPKNYRKNLKFCSDLTKKFLYFANFGHRWITEVS
jgi:hypothetical protein